MKIKRRIQKVDLERANKILQKCLEGNSDTCKVIDAVYAMARKIEERLGMKRRNKNDNNEDNRKIRKITSKLKLLTQVVARMAAEIHKRKIRRKHSEKILRRLREKAQNPVTEKSQLVKVFHDGKHLLGKRINS